MRALLKAEVPVTIEVSKNFIIIHLLDKEIKLVGSEAHEFLQNLSDFQIVE